ncbi:L-fucose:H+ symporter permease [Fulvivirgaceae bacterium BMA12]|uniref:L-fucose:H+ symporter permease n=1 Tax=Agaribacillus aureus TaxID=3051825 RepID=A0ABT8L6H5_9BACT|nr:L-fucose:H+ symporter permease [Fulvivirgaceae bacterium BMA12]
MKKKYILPFILVTSLFFLWGIANNMTDTLLAVFKKVMSMTDFQTSWIQVAFYGAYFCSAIPAALYIKKYTYKSGVLLGLGLFAFGSLMFYPASFTMSYGHFLASLFILASGLSILETTANPYIIAMGPPETGTYRLNLAQSFNPIGSITGVLLSKVFILSHLNAATKEERAQMSAEQLDAIQSEELSAVMGPYVGVAVVLLVLWVIIKFTNMPKASDAGPDLNFIPTFKRLIKIPHYVWGVVAQFFYLGAQLGTWSFTIRYVMSELNLNEDDASNYYLAALFLFTASRFVFTFLMRFISARKLLMMAAIFGALCTTIVIFGHGYIAVYALVSVSFSLSLMFPTIFGLAVRGLGDDTKIGGAGVIMAILGGAVFPLIQGLVSDATNIHFSFAIPLVCFIVVVVFGATGAKLEPQTAPQQE